LPDAGIEAAPGAVTWTDANDLARRAHEVPGLARRFDAGRRYGAVLVRRLVLASASPRRAQLLGQLGVVFEVRPADLDESVWAGEDARAYVERLARAKAAAVSAEGERELVIAADTTVEVDGEILGKPLDEADAARMLRLLSGRVHRVHTGLAVADRSVVVTTEVRFVELGEPDITWYVGTGEPLDKAGGYAIQGAAGAFVAAIDGSASNVVGLPLAELVTLLRASGFDPLR
jgi:septum formation protein